jgi:predicted DNA-binding transcriptional regulator AlpA
MESLLTYTDIASALGVCEKTVSRWVNAGVGPTPIRINRKMVRFSPAAVAEWRNGIGRAI